jgi:hypothetical protein
VSISWSRTGRAPNPVLGPSAGLGRDWTAATAGRATRSSSVFQPSHSGQRPSQRGAFAPHALQMNSTLVFAMLLVASYCPCGATKIEVTVRGASIPDGALPP